ncbi:hypothetical protein [Actinomadura macrotermitis]|uniref:Uncharacterized protein n=1 Tax=Actinomadura macrotermitis TaxID=2585200 RepID=A0A7K0C4F3_9ACTN|nr:hypothetical protein [Actinomadura macrotermitis]MQY08320.1 hypothetical protein [Actinomadura macrotermitis]
MPKTWMIAEYLRPFVRWRINRADPSDGGRNARAAIGLIDAAAYAMQTRDDVPAVARMTAAGCFAGGRFDPGAEGEAIIRGWHYDTPAGSPADLLNLLAEAAERTRAVRPSGAGKALTARRPLLPRPRRGA